MPAVTPVHVEAVSTLAVIAASNEPLLFLASDLTVIAASASFCRAFQIEPASIPGRLLSELGAGEWGMPQLTSLLKATASGSAEVEAYEIDLIRKGHQPRCLVLNAHKLDDGDHRVRVLLAVTDVTLARAESRHKDELIREKATLLQEVQHRVANSLQIIASVLMQSARRVQSDEARGFLHDAHHRLMSIATVQRHLAMSAVGEVALRPYFIQLCESLAASMIHDRSQLSIGVDVDDSVVSANVSVSLGLIITELVINSLKHAFPHHRAGNIAVKFSSEKRNWTLSVADDGVGMPVGEKKPKPGLGTGIVQALSGQLGGIITIADARPGARFTLVHEAEAETPGAPMDG